MAKKVKFPLKMADGAEVRTLEELKEHFDVDSVIKEFFNDRLLTWLEDRYYDEEADQVRTLTTDDLNLQKKFCAIFGVETPEIIAWRKERLERLKKYTRDEKILACVDFVAFNQEELADLLDEDAKEIYLCENRFVIPLRVKNKNYFGVGKAIAVIRSKEPVDFDKLNITFKEITFDDAYQKIIYIPPKIEPPKSNSSVEIFYPSSKSKSSVETFYPSSKSKSSVETFYPSPQKNNYSQNTPLKSGEHSIKAPRAGRVTKIDVEENEVVNAGDLLLKINTVYGEIPITADNDGIVKKIFVRDGEYVLIYQPLVVMEKKQNYNPVKQSFPSYNRGREHSINAPKAGRINRIKVVENEVVSAGDVLLKINTPYGEMPITADTYGVVKKILVRDGENVETYQPLVVIN
ncbi:MAG: biotin/lipoyl-binding protein [Selenomonadaceae bacterium]|nr:biotin/lipoyl-binding protein [Selenomonadaceae bacterium]